MSSVALNRPGRGLPVMRLTFKEVFSRKLVVWGVILSGVFLALFGLGYTLLYQRTVAQEGPDAFIQGLASSILLLFGLFVVSFLAAFLALLVSVASVSGEIDNGTLQAVLARPLRRWSWLLQRWAGMAVIIGAYVATMSTALLLIAAGVAGHRSSNAVLMVLLMVAQSVAVLTLGMFASTRLSTLAAGVISFSLFGLAWLGGIIELIGDVFGNTAMVNTGVAVSLLMPSDALWRGASFYAQAPAMVRQSMLEVGGILPFAGNAPPTTLSLLWAAGWAAVLLALSVRRFSRRDL
jgi:Cu-processing system permease protein